MSTIAIEKTRKKEPEEVADAYEGEREVFGAYLLDDQSRGVAMELAKQRGWPTTEVVRGGLAGALRTLSIAPPPRFVVVDIGPALSYDEVAEGIAEIARAGAVVIALGERNDVQLYRLAMEAGARDYLVKPVDLGGLNAAFAKVETPATGDGQAGRTIAFVGARGGVGTSQVVSNCAWLMAEVLRRKVFLVDLDVQFGTLALLLDVQAPGGLVEALQDPERVDQVFLEHASVRLGKQLHLLATEGTLADQVVVEPKGAATLIGQVAKLCDVALVDLPRHVAMQNHGLLGSFDEVVVITDSSLVGLRDACRLLRMMRARYSNTKIHVVVNHHEPKAAVASSELAKGLEQAIDYELPYARDAVLRAEMAGEPLAKAAPKNALVQALTRLTVHLAGVREAPKRAPLMRRLLKR